MLTSKNEHGSVIASAVSKSDGPFFCIGCGARTMLKQGGIRIPHFSHYPDEGCGYGAGETELHREAKLAIYNALKSCSSVQDLELERPMGAVRPDIYYYDKGVEAEIAIEVQVSSLQPEEIQDRTEEYAEQGIYVLWVSPMNGKLVNGERYSPGHWERYIHEMYLGQVLYWTNDDTVRQVKFDEYMLHREPSYGYGEYYYASKRYRTAVFGNKMRIRDFILCDRPECNYSDDDNYGPYSPILTFPYIPECKLALPEQYMDKVEDGDAKSGLDEAWDRLVERGYNPPETEMLAKEARIHKTEAAKYRMKRFKQPVAA